MIPSVILEMQNNTVCHIFQVINQLERYHNTEDGAGKNKLFSTNYTWVMLELTKSYLHLIHKHRWSRVADTVYLLYTVPHTLYKSTVEKGDLLLLGLYRHTLTNAGNTLYFFVTGRWRYAWLLCKMPRKEEDGDNSMN